MRLSMAVLLLALVLAPVATEAESEKKEAPAKKTIDLMLDMSIAEVKKLKGKPITLVNLGDTTTVLSFDDVRLIFRNDKLAGVLELDSHRWWLGDLGRPLKAKEEEMMRIMEKRGTPPEEFKKTYRIPSMHFGRAEPETIKLTLGMSTEEVVKLGNYIPKCRKSLTFPHFGTILLKIKQT